MRCFLFSPTAAALGVGLAGTFAPGLRERGLEACLLVVGLALVLGGGFAPVFFRSAGILSLSLNGRAGQRAVRPTGGPSADQYRDQ